jgi:anti-sigma regulatory factor (Ser/Thr protein kinase)
MWAEPACSPASPGYRQGMGGGSEARVPPRSQTLPAGPHTSSEARWFLFQTLGDELPWERLHLAALLTTELASNAARHGSEKPGTPIEVKAETRGQQLRVTVHDQGPGFDPVSVIEESQSTGLRLVDRLSTRWGVDRPNRGTDVWFEI